MHSTNMHQDIGRESEETLWHPGYWQRGLETLALTHQIDLSLSVTESQGPISFWWATYSLRTVGSQGESYLGSGSGLDKSVAIEFGAMDSYYTLEAFVEAWSPPDLRSAIADGSMMPYSDVTSGLPANGEHLNQGIGDLK
jgi:hypothetical protein